MHHLTTNKTKGLFTAVGLVIIALGVFVSLILIRQNQEIRQQASGDPNPQAICSTSISVPKSEVGGKCSENSDCSNDGEPLICVGVDGATLGTCSQSPECTTDDDCNNQPTAKFCDPDIHVCVECAGDDNCSSGVCNVNICVECVNNDDCPSGVCNVNICVECMDDNDCEQGRTCRNNECVLSPPTPTNTPTVTPTLTPTSTPTPDPNAQKASVVGYIFYDRNADGTRNCGWDSKNCGCSSANDVCSTHPNEAEYAECCWKQEYNVDSSKWRVTVSGAASQQANTSFGGWYQTGLIPYGSYTVSAAQNGSTSVPYSFTTQPPVKFGVYVGQVAGQSWIDGRADFGVLPTSLVPNRPTATPVPPSGGCDNKDRADLDCDGDIDLEDYKILIKQFSF